MDTRDSPMSGDQRANKVFVAHILLIALILAAHVGCKILMRISPTALSSRTDQLFDLALENNVPTYFSSLALIATAGVAIVIAMRASALRKGPVLSWLFVAVCLFFMAADEAFAIHDGFSPALRAQWETSGAFFHAWTLVYGALAIVVVLLCLPLVRHLSRATFARLAVAAVVFLGSAIGFELIQSMFLSEALGPESSGTVNWETVQLNPLNALTVILEEAGEMLGVALALRALILHYDTEMQGNSATKTA